MHLDSLSLPLLQFRSTPEAPSDASRRLLTEQGMMDPTFVPRYHLAPHAVHCQNSAVLFLRGQLYKGVYICQACKAMWQGMSGTLWPVPAVSHLLGRHSILTMLVQDWGCCGVGCRQCLSSLLCVHVLVGAEALLFILYCAPLYRQSLLFE